MARFLHLGAFIFVAAILHTKSVIALSQHEIIKRLLYQADVSSNPPGPVTVQTNIYLRRIDDVNEEERTLEVQLTLRQSWTDPRLAYQSIEESSNNDSSSSIPNFVNIPVANGVWKPDTFFSNDVEARRHDIDAPNNLVRIYPNGNVLYSTRLAAKFACNMDLSLFPFDTQSCAIELGSYGYTTDQIGYEWKELDAIQVKFSVDTSTKFILRDVTTETCDSITSTGEYSCLRVKFELKRCYGRYILQIFFSTAFFVAVSWLVFWLPNSAKTEKAAILIATLLPLIAVTAATAYKTPFTAYLKAIDVWFGACFIFWFGALVTFAIGGCNPNKQYERVNENDIMTGDFSKRKKTINLCHWGAGVLFPVAFAVFVLCFMIAIAAS